MRDANYAVLAALGLTLVVGLWALLNPSLLADPGQPAQRAPLSAALPVPAALPSQETARDTAAKLLAERDPFTSRSLPEAELRRFATAKIAPPVTLRPVRPARPGPQRLQVVPSRPAPAPAPVQARPEPPRAQPAPAPRQAALPQAQPRKAQPQRPSAPEVPFRLRGVFPNPRDGGRALLAMQDGRVFSVGLGSVVAGWQLMRIGPASIEMAGPRGEVRRLQMRGY